MSVPTRFRPVRSRWLSLISLGAGLLVVMAAAGCGPSKYVLLRVSAVEKRKLTAEELKSLQFYVDAPLELSRVVSDSAAGATRGRLVTRNDVIYEVVNLLPGSPGAAVSVQLNRRSIFVSFEPGADLLFEPGPRKWSDFYTLWYSAPDSTRLRLYGGQTYMQRGTPRLMVERKALSRITAERSGGR